MANVTTSVAECATKLNNLQPGESLTIMEKDFRPVVTIWAQQNPGKTLWVEITLTDHWDGSVVTEPVSLESSIRGKVKGEALELFRTIGLDDPITIRPMSVEVESDAN